MIITFFYFIFFTICMSAVEVTMTKKSPKKTLKL